MFFRSVKAPIFILGTMLTLQSCTKQIAEPQLYDPFKTTGFFLDDWKPKTFLPFTYKDIDAETSGATADITVFDDAPRHKLSTYLNGNNANPFSGQMIEHPKLLKNIRDLDPGILRYPGGDISSIYFWDRTKWNPPTDVPKQLYLSKVKEPTYIWFGLNNEPWTLSLENYYKVLSATNTTGMITVNYAYARYGTGKNPVNNAAHYAANWVRHDKGRTKLWEVGNESYGYWQGGWMIDTALTKNQPQIISGGLYGSHFKIFADSMRQAAREIGVKIKIGAQLVTHPVDAKVSPSEVNWNSTYFQSAADDADFYIVHNYFTPFGENNNPQEVLASAEKVVTEIKQTVKNSLAQNGRIQKPVAMTEWNIFAMGSKQKMSNIAGVHAVLTMGEMHKANFGMAARWHILGKYDNGNDFATISSGDDPENHTPWLPRPVFYYMYYYQKMAGDFFVQTKVNGDPSIAAYASKYQSGAVSLNIINKGTKPQTVKIKLNSNTLGRYYYYLLNGEPNVPYSRKVFINGVGPSDPSGGPEDYLRIPARSSQINNNIHIVIPPYGVVFLLAD